MLRLLAASLAGLLLCLSTGHAAQLGFHCTITHGNTGASDLRTI